MAMEMLQKVRQDRTLELIIMVLERKEPDGMIRNGGSMTATSGKHAPIFLRGKHAPVFVLINMAPL